MPVSLFNRQGSLSDLLRLAREYALVVTPVTDDLIRVSAVDPLCLVELDFSFADGDVAFVDVCCP
jgi:hypothetical protein